MLYAKVRSLGLYQRQAQTADQGGGGETAVQTLSVPRLQEGRPCQDDEESASLPITTAREERNGRLRLTEFKFVRKARFDFQNNESAPESNLQFKNNDS